MGYYKEWNVPQPSIKILCPIDNTRSKKSHTEDDQSEDNEAVDIARAPEARANGEGDGRARVPRRRIQAAGINAQPMNINGRRMLICNVNGVYFQVWLYTHTHMYMYTHIHMYIHTCIYTHTCIYIHTHVDIYTHVDIHMYMYYTISLHMETCFKMLVHT